MPDTLASNLTSDSAVQGFLLKRKLTLQKGGAKVGVTDENAWSRRMQMKKRCRLYIFNWHENNLTTLVTNERVAHLHGYD